MRIGLVLPGFSDGEADWCIPAVRDLVAWLARGHDVRVFALRYPYRRVEYRAFGARVVALGGGEAARLARGPLLARALASVFASGRRQRFDVLHGLWADEPGLVACLAGRLLGVPAVVSLMGGELARLPEIGYGGQRNRANRALTAASMRLAAGVSAGSGWMGQEPVLPLGIDPDRFRPPGAAGAGAAGRPLRLLQVASLVPVKGQRDLLAALALLPGCELHLVGDGPLRAELACLAARLGLADRVIFHGAVAHDKLPGLYAAADVYVQSSLHESQGMAVLEAAACGCDVTGTAVGVLANLLPESAVPPGDPRALAGAIQALADPGARQERAAALQERVAREFSLPGTAERLVKWYRGS